MTPDELFLQARDFLIHQLEDYAVAYRHFAWPQLDHFNRALDNFDPYAKGNDRLALWIVNEGGGETKVSFAELSGRSNRVANFLRQLGVQRGDRTPISTSRWRGTSLVWGARGSGRNA